MRYTPARIGEIIRQTCKALGMMQKGLALTAAGTDLRFIIDLEKGKPTCLLDKMLVVLHTLGISAPIEPKSLEGTSGRIGEYYGMNADILKGFKIFYTPAVGGIGD